MTRRGFSLLELLVAIVIIATLVGTMTGFVFDVLRTRDALSALTARERATGVLFDMLERDLQTVIATGPDGGSGVSGDGSGLRLAVAATPVRLAVPGRGAQALGTVDWLDVRFDAASRAVRVRRISVAGGDSSGAVASAASASAPAPADDEAPMDDPGFEDGSLEDDAGVDDPAFTDDDAGRPVDPNSIGGEFFLVEFRYHDGTGWQDRFDSAGGGLPVAIDVAVWFEPWPGALLEDEFAGNEGEGDEAGFALGAGDEVFDPERFAADEGVTAADPEAGRPLPDRRRIIAIPDARAGEVADAFAAAADGAAAAEAEAGP